MSTQISHTHLLLQQAESEFRLKRYSQSIRTFREVIKLDLQNKRAWNGLATTLYHEGKIQMALDAIICVHDFHPTDLSILENMFEIAKACKNHFLCIDSASKLYDSIQEPYYKNQLELFGWLPSNRAVYLLIEDEDGELAGYDIFFKALGFITHRLSQAVISAIATLINQEPQQTLSLICHAIAPTAMVMLHDKKRDRILQNVAKERNTPFISIGANHALDGGFALTNVEDEQTLRSYIEQIGNPVRTQGSPLFQLNCEGTNIDSVQKLAMSAVGQSIPSSLFRINIIHPSEAQQKELSVNNKAFLFSPIENSRSLPIPPQDLVDSDALKRRLLEGYHKQGTEFHGSQLVARSIAPVCAAIRGWGNTDKTRRCLQSLRTHYSKEQLRIIYVDNGSDVHEFNALCAEFNDVEMVRFPENMGSCRGINAGLLMGSLEKHKYYLIVDNDAWPPFEDDTWLDRWLEYFKKPNVGAAGATSDIVKGAQNIEVCPQTYMRDFKRADGSQGKKNDYTVPIVITFGVMFRREALESIGWFADERFEPGNCEDADLALRMREAGWDIVIAKSVWLHHEGNQTFRENVEPLCHKNIELLKEKYGHARLQRLEYFNTLFVTKQG